MSDVAVKNIFARFWEFTADPLWRRMKRDPVSWLLLGMFVFLCIFGALLQFGVIALSEGYKENSWVFLYVAWLLLVLSIIAPMAQIFEEHDPARLSIFLTASIGLVVIFVLISIVVLAENHSKNPQAITTLLAGLAAAAMVGVGWTVQAEVAHRSARRTHTCNVIMQSRLSASFRELAEIKNQLAIDFPVVDSNIAQLSTQAGVAEFVAKNPGVDKRGIEKILASFRAVIAILDYYEFMAAGVRNKDLDEDLIRIALRGMLVKLFTDYFEVIQHCAKERPRAFCELETLVRKWDPEVKAIIRPRV